MVIFASWHCSLHYHLIRFLETSDDEQQQTYLVDLSQIVQPQVVLERLPTIDGKLNRNIKNFEGNFFWDLLWTFFYNLFYIENFLHKYTKYHIFNIDQTKLFSYLQKVKQQKQYLWEVPHLHMEWKGGVQKQQVGQHA